MGRPGAWHLLDRDSDPVPASEDDVLEVATAMQRRGESVGDVRDTLAALSELDGWRGRTAETFAEKAGEVVGNLEKAEERYAAVAGALGGWARDVGAARTATQDALSKAEDADAAMRRHPLPDAGGPLTPEQEQDKTAHDRAAGELRAARDDLDRALGALDDAAEAAAGRIRDAADTWNDGWWGGVERWVREHAELIDVLCKALEVIAMVLGAIVLVCAIVVTAPFWLVAAAVGVGVLLLAGHVLLTTADTGKADWGDVAWDVVGIAATLVGGKAAASALKGVGRLVPAMASRIGAEARTASLARQVGSNTTQFRNALRIQNPANNLARWTTRLQGAAAAEGRAAARGVEDVLQLAPARLQALLAQDRQLARLRAVLGQLGTYSPTAREAEQIARNLRLVWTGIGANTVGTGVWGKDLPKNLEAAEELVRRWVTRPAS